MAETSTSVRPLRADAQRNRDKLISVARDEFRRTGPETSLEKIAKEAGVGIGTLYRHFPSRLDLVVAVYQEDIDRLVQASLATDAPAWEALRSWVDGFLDLGTTKRVLLTELAAGTSQGSEVFDLCRTQLREAAKTVLQRAQQAGEARSDVDSGDLIRLIGGIAVGGIEHDQAVRLARIVLDGIRSPA